MDVRLDPNRFVARQRRKRTREQIDRYNPDRYGRMSTGAIIIAFGLLIAAIAVFTFQWIYIANEDAQSRREIDRLQNEFDVLEAFIANFSTACDCANVNVTFRTEFPDDEFTVFNAVDPSRLLQISANGISTMTLQSLTIQNASGIVAYLSDIPVYPDVFLDDVFTVVNVLDNTREVMLNCSVIATGTTRIMTIQDASGTIAYLSDIPTPTSVFEDDVFAVQNFLDQTREVQLNAGGITSGTTVVMTVQNTDGTIAYLDDIVLSNGTYSDTVFVVQDDGDSTRQVRLDLSSVSAGSLSLMGIQDMDGTIAYVDQANIYVDVTISSSRTFPNMANEGQTTLAGLGVTQLQIWVCGPGGGGGGALGSVASGSGGGSGSGVEAFFVDNAASLFSALTCTIGVGGSGGTGSLMVPTNGDDGGTTSVIGVPIVAGTTFLELYGYGGGGGGFGNVSGAGGGSGGIATASIGGPAGPDGGLAGAEGGAPGAIRYPWHAGSSGGSALISNGGAPWYGGGAGGLNGGGGIGGGGGAGGLFGTGGDGGIVLNDNGNPGGVCAGGGGTAFTDSSNSGGDGGDGQIIVRYWIA